MKSKRIVLVGGCFDILHFGHIHFLKKAGELGDYLVVALESDANIKKLKGSSRPIHNQEQRKEILKSLSFVNEVIVLSDNMTDKDYLELVLTVKPNIIATTTGDPGFKKKMDHALKIKAEVVEIEKIEVASGTKIAKLLEIE